MATYSGRIGKVHSIVIANNDTDSDILDFFTNNRRTMVLTIFSPATVSNTITVEISPDGTNWSTLQSAGADISLPAAKGTVVSALGPCFLRVLSSANEGAERTFKVVATSLGA